MVPYFLENHRVEKVGKKRKTDSMGFSWNGLVGWIVVLHPKQVGQKVKIQKHGRGDILGQTGQKAMLVPVTLDQHKMGESWVPCGCTTRGSKRMNEGQGFLGLS